MNPSTLLDALAFAAEKHRYQRRKDAEASPYINHPIAVAHVLATEAHSVDEVTLVAALLHDTVEDTETTDDELRHRFGEEVAQIVAEVTDDKSLPKEERKKLQIRHAARASDRAKRLKMADKICNIRDITLHPPEDWSMDRRRDYLIWAEKVVAGCRGVDAGLEDAFDEAVRAARESLNLDA
jgi:guanosine-3',5'-bis(diphosphate) 3'-pyrophosphohydrolase